MPTKFFSARVVLILTSILTLVLLLGSVFLQRIVFHAGQTSSSVYLDPASFALKSGNQVTVALKSQADQVSLVSGGQFSLHYDPAALTLKSTTPAAGWRTEKLGVGDGQLNWALLPQDDTQPLVKLSGTIVWGTLTFQGVKNGAADLSFNQESTLIAVVDSQSTTAPYNAVSTVQDAHGAISDTAESQVPATPDQLSAVPSNLPESAGSSAVRSDILPYATSAQLLVSLPNPERVTVHFGEDTKLTSQAQSTQLVNNVVLPLSGLKPSTRYYYKLVAQDDAGSQTTTQLKSFQTSTLGIGPVSADQSEVKIFPALSQDKTAAYILLRNAAGQVVSGLQPTVSVTKGNAEASIVSDNQGVYQFSVISQARIKQSGALSVVIGSVHLPEAAFQFDPNYQATPAATSQSVSETLVFNHTAIWTLLALFLALLLSGWLFYRLARIR